MVDLRSRYPLLMNKVNTFIIMFLTFVVVILLSSYGKLLNGSIVWH